MLAQGPGYPHLEDLQPRDAARTPNFPRSVSSQQIGKRLNIKQVGWGRLSVNPGIGFKCCSWSTRSGLWERSSRNPHTWKIGYGCSDVQSQWNRLEQTNQERLVVKSWLGRKPVTHVARLCASALFMAPGDHELELQWTAGLAFLTRVNSTSSCIPRGRDSRQLHASKR